MAGPAEYGDPRTCARCGWTWDDHSPDCQTFVAHSQRNNAAWRGLFDAYVKALHIPQFATWLNARLTRGKGD